MSDALPVLFLAVLLAVAVRCLTTAITTGRRPKPPPSDRADEYGIWHECHNPACGGHGPTVHRYTTAGLVCTGCGRPAE
ncbi:hypothetical protein [Streptomyces sp. NPDC096095]|uniref:hypothetical protein n=1 Tax=Streptomyces sp. NPDC096095 TaxID=3155545 RepID=UPI003316F10D